MKLSYHLACVLLLGTSGCVVEAMDDELAAELAVGHEDTTEDTGTASEELQSTGEVGLAQGQPVVGLGPTSDRVCFLTGIKGNFAGLTERVRVYTSGGSWYLDVDSAQTGVGAWASCAYAAAGTYTGEYTWDSAVDNYPKHMGTATGRVCFLTRIQGGFNNGSEWVHLYVSGGDWYMTGKTGGPALRAGARCVSVPSYSGEVSWGTDDLAQYVGSTKGYSCGLTRIIGSLDSGADKIHCDRITDSWYLTGQATTGNLGVRARLF
ncbi:hypothetical protein [Polyangium jinanense]|uniref:Uncharacterized protein n=1 Tax=Polyangium jinanense TaxID=2829994 RepID=A0A9X4ASP4_9BACT|nr:hypothetical protein [Polyangium jinanense]MDC3954895.1 hypothetical protein [Polyangium jinanense]MDC3981335.1 hypothetical protein [Polyangium jinanense]